MLNDKNNITDKNIFLSVMKFSVPTWVNFIISILSTPILTRAYLPDQYALITIFNTTTNLVMYLVSFGLDGGYIRFYNEPPNNENHKLMLDKILVLFAFGTILFSIITIFLGNEISNKLFGIDSFFLSYLLVVNVFSTILLRFLNITYRMSMNSKQYTIQNILINLVFKIGAFIAIPISRSANIAIFFQVTLLFILSIVYSYYQRNDIIYYPAFKKNAEKEDRLLSFKGYGEFIKYSLFNAPNYIISNSNLFICQQIIRTRLGNSFVGIFSSAGYFSSLLEVARGGFSVYWSAYMYKNYKTNSKEIIKVHDYMIIFSATMFWGLIAFKDIIYLLIGREYRESKLFFSVLLFGNILRLCCETTTYGITIKKRTDISLILNFISCAINIVLCYIFVNLFGLIGAAYANMISNVVYCFLATYIGQKFYKSIKSKGKTFLVVCELILMAIIPSVVMSAAFQILLCTIVLLFIYIQYRKEILDIFYYIKKFLRKE